MRPRPEIDHVLTPDRTAEIVLAASSISGTFYSAVLMAIGAPRIVLLTAFALEFATDVAFAFIFFSRLQYDSWPPRAWSVRAWFVPDFLSCVIPLLLVTGPVFFGLLSGDVNSAAVRGLAGTSIFGRIVYGFRAFRIFRVFRLRDTLEYSPGTVAPYGAGRFLMVDFTAAVFTFSFAAWGSVSEFLPLPSLEKEAFAAVTIPFYFSLLVCALGILAVHRHGDPGHINARPDSAGIAYLSIDTMGKAIVSARESTPPVGEAEIAGILGKREP